MNVRVAKAGLRVTEVPSVEHERLHGESKLNAWRDGRRVLRVIIRERMSRSTVTDGGPGNDWHPPFSELTVGDIVGDDLAASG
jgi:hypothetical protein